MNYYNYLVESLMLEVTSDEKYNRQYLNKLDRNLFDKAVELDPTSIGVNKVGKYVDWIIRNKLFDKEDVKDLLAKFEKFKEKFNPNERDINKLTYDRLKEIIEELENSGQLVSKKDKIDINRKKAEEESEVVFNDEQYIVIIPKTKFASRYFGAGSDWCTARQDDRTCMYDHYAGNGNLYIVKDKKTNEKFQLYLSNDKTQKEYKDSNNRSFNPFDRFDNDSDFIEFLEEKKFKESNELTEEQAKSLAEDFLSEINFNTESKLYKDAVDILTSYFEGYNEYGYDENIELYNYIQNSEMGDLVYTYEKSQDILKDNGIDPEKEENMMNLVQAISYDGEDLDYNLKRFFEGKNEDYEGYDWVYNYEGDINNMFEIFSNNKNIYSFEDIDKEFLKNWLEFHYKNDEKNNKTDFDDFYDDFIGYYDEQFAKPMTDEDKKELKKIVDEVGYKMYQKSDHPKLDLNSIHYLASKYLY